MSPFVPGFTSLVDVDLGVGGLQNYFVYPLRSLSGVRFMLIQLYKSTKAHSFHFYQERNKLNLITRVFLFKLEALQTEQKVSGANDRTIEILNSCKSLYIEMFAVS